MKTPDEINIVDILRHEVQSFGVPGAPDIVRIQAVALIAADTIEMLECSLDIAKMVKERITAQRDSYFQELKNVSAGACARIKELESRLAQAERERDAAVNDLCTTCATCKHNDYSWSKCKIGGYHHGGCDPYCDNWEWRGPCPENTKEDAHA